MCCWRITPLKRSLRHHRPCRLRPLLWRPLCRPCPQRQPLAHPGGRLWRVLPQRLLPLLEAQTVQAGLVGPDVFLAGYGAAQAVPGPLFTFAAFLGFVAATPPNGAAGAGLALIAIFLPSALLIIGVHPFWERLRASSAATRALAGVNAAVVGILAAALYTPVFTAGIDSPAALALAAACFVALRVWNAPPWAVVLAAGALGASILG